MKWNGLQVYVIMGVFLLGTALIFGVQSLVDRYEVRGPLVRGAQAVDGVEQVRLESGQHGTNLVVKMGATRDLRGSYAKLQELLSRYLGNAAGTVVIQDTRSGALQKSYDGLQFVIQEGIATGRFEAMRRAFQRGWREAGLSKAEIYIDSQRVYVALEDAGVRLYEVIARHPAAGASAGSAQVDGGEGGGGDA